MRPRLVLLAFLLPACAPACMWDSDTLAEESGLGKDYLAIIVGRFPRNPPLYFAMRRDRLLAKKSKSAADYDDLAVAYERLGDSLTALKWIDRKPKGSAEDEYRTHANRGTFLIHAWLAGKEDARAGKRGLEELGRALAINPDAHFGRERVQIELVKALLDPKLAEPLFNDQGDRHATAERDAQGYAGIVRLGAGWNSPDVFRMLAIDLAAARVGHQRLGALASPALLRADELQRSGAKARLDDGMGFKMVDGSQTPELMDNTREEFVRLRKEADAWQARRTAFMLARLEQGRHPDTDPTFWQGWSDGKPPEVRSGWILDTFGAPVPWPLVALGFLVAGLCVALPLLGLFLVGRALWRWSAKLRRS